jgi:MoaA/NifB/PqqE/SkfB family radical SAM enzyme
MCYQVDFSPRSNMPASIYRDRMGPILPRVKSVIMSGGEPTVMPNCRELATLLRQMPQVRLVLTTNGVRIDEFWFETFLRQTDYLNFSLNAASEDAYRRIVAFGNWTQALRNVATVIERRTGPKPLTSISAVVLKENVCEMAELIRLGKQLGVDAVEFLTDPLLSYAGLPEPQIVQDQLKRADEARAETGLKVGGLGNFGRRFGFTPSEPDKPSGQRRNVCPVPFQHSVIDSNGDVRVCCNTWEPVGNLYSRSFDEIWNGETLRHWRDRLAHGDYSRCEPYCTDNPKPSRLALAYKYGYLVANRPLYFVTKVREKVKQLRRARAAR